MTDTKRHGVIGTYVGGCRCEDCRRANREYHREYRRTHKGRIAMRHARARRYAEIMALAYLRKHDKRAYFEVYDAAKARAEA